MSKIVSIRKVANGSFQAEMTGLVERPGAVNVLAHLNKGDARFRSGSERRVWFPVTLATLQEDFNLPESTISNIMNLEQGERFELAIENPNLQGEKLAIQVRETTIPDAWQKQNIAKSAKQLMITDKVASSKIKTEYDLTKYVGQNGYFLDEEGHFIFSRTSVNIASQINHVFVEGTFVPESELPSYGETLASAKVGDAAMQEA